MKLSLYSQVIIKNGKVTVIAGQWSDEMSMSKAEIKALKFNLSSAGWSQEGDTFIKPASQEKRMQNTLEQAINFWRIQ